MNSFENFNLSKQLQTAIEDLGFDKPTPMQKEVHPVILSGKDVVGIAQTGTGKTFAYMLPILQNLKFTKEIHPTVLILVPTRELVMQVVGMTQSFAKYINIRVLGVFGGTNINTQKIALANGTDILVATPGRLYDLIISGSVQLKGIKKLVIDEVDVMLDAGFRFQITNILDLLPKRRQNIMFSATMTEEVDMLIEDFFTVPVKISTALSGTPLENISQQCFHVPNFYTKVNLLLFLLTDIVQFSKVLVFVADKKTADKLYEELEKRLGSQVSVIHSNKTQNYRFRSISQFDTGQTRLLVSTDIMARGLDLEKISHVINFDTPQFPENYIHRIGRTGRAEQEGKSILFYTDKEKRAKEMIETLMAYKIPALDLPAEVEISGQLTEEERPKIVEVVKNHHHKITEVKGAAFHEKKEKNKKTNQGGSYLRKMKVYKKPKTRGDKNANRRKKNK
jgi:ATP-dependent RNA helicase RhlE